MAVNPTRPIKIRRKQAKHYFKKIKKNSIKKLGKYEGRKRYRTVKTKLGQNKYNLPVIKRIAHARDLESPQTSVGIENILRKKLFQGRKRQVSSQRVPTAPPANNNNNSSSGGGSSVGGNTITIGGGSGVDSTTRPAPKSNNREISQLSDTVKDFIREQSFQTANLSNLFSSLREIQSRAVDVKPDLPELSFFRERIKQIEQEKPAMDSLLNSTNQQLQNQWMQIKQQERDIDDLRNKPINYFKPDKRKLAQRIANLEASSSSIEPKLLRKLDKQKQKSILYQSEFDRRLNALANQDRRDKDPPAAVVDASINASIEDLKQRLNQKEISSSTFEKSIAELISEKNKLAGRVSSLESNPNLLSDLKFAPASIKQEIDDLKVQLDNQEISSGKFLNSLKKLREKSKGISTRLDTQQSEAQNLLKELEQLKTNNLISDSEFTKRINSLEALDLVSPQEFGKAQSLISSLSDTQESFLQKFKNSDTRFSKLQEGVDKNFASINALSSILKNTGLNDENLNKVSEILSSANQTEAARVEALKGLFGELELSRAQQASIFEKIALLEANQRRLADRPTPDFFSSDFNRFRQENDARLNNNVDNDRFNSSVTNFNKRFDDGDNNAAMLAQRLDGIPSSFKNMIDDYGQTQANNFNSRFSTQQELLGEQGTKQQALVDQLNEYSLDNTSKITALDKALRETFLEQFGTAEEKRTKELFDINTNFKNIASDRDRFDQSFEQMDGRTTDLTKRIEDVFNNLTGLDTEFKNTASSQGNQLNTLSTQQGALANELFSLRNNQQPLEETPMENPLLTLNERIQNLETIIPKSREEISTASEALKQKIVSDINSIRTSLRGASKPSGFYKESRVKPRWSKLVKNAEKALKPVATVSTTPTASPIQQDTVAPKIVGGKKRKNIKTKLVAPPIPIIEDPEPPAVSLLPESVSIPEEPAGRRISQRLLDKASVSIPNFVEELSKEQDTATKALKKSEIASARRTRRLFNTDVSAAPYNLRSRNLKKPEIEFINKERTKTNKIGQKLKTALEKVVPQKIETVGEADNAIEKLDNIIIKEKNPDIAPYFQKKKIMIDPAELSNKLEPAEPKKPKLLMSQIKWDELQNVKENEQPDPWDQLKTARAQAAASPNYGAQLAEAKKYRARLREATARRAPIDYTNPFDRDERFEALADVMDEIDATNRPPPRSQLFSPPPQATFIDNINDKMLQLPVPADFNPTLNVLQPWSKQEADAQGLGDVGDSDEVIEDEQTAGGRRFYKPPRLLKMPSLPFVEITNKLLPNISHYKTFDEARGEMGYNQDPNIMFNLLGDNSNDFLHSLFYNNFKTRQNKPMMLTREEVEVNPAIYDNLGFNTWSESLLQPRGKVIDKHVLHTRNLLRQITPKRKSVEAFYNQAECMPGLIINADNNSVCYRDRLNNLQPLVNNGNKLSNMFKDQRKAQHPLLYLWIDNFKNQQNKREVIFRTPHWRNNKHIQYKKWV